MATDTTSETISNPELRHRNSTSTQQQSRNSTSSNGTAGSSLQHDFRTTTFTSPTFCDYCGSFIWGLAKQGCSCRDCGFAAHKHCFRFVSSSCAAKAGPKSLGMPRSLSNELSQSNHPSSARQQHEISEKEKDLVTQIFAETQVQSKKLENTYLETNPALNIALLLKQNNRFTARQAPFIWINETVIKLLTWDSVPNTLIFLLCYVILCNLLTISTCLTHLKLCRPQTHFICNFATARYFVFDCKVLSLSSRRNYEWKTSSKTTPNRNTTHNSNPYFCRKQTCYAIHSKHNGPSFRRL